MADDNAVPGAEQARLGQIGPYQLLKLIGEGAAGQVFLAEQQQPHRQVALKVLRSAAGAGRARFEREVSLLASLEHTNIARLYDSGTAEGPAGEVPYLVMEHVDGLDLIQYARQQQLNTEQRLQLLAQVARAAHFAHTRGVIHRDLKPGNILVNQRGEPKILDFGVAHVVADDATQMTGAGEVLGTLSYMSWEQLCGEANSVDARSDVYALGVIGYQLLSGVLPYPGLSEDTLVSALGRIQRERPARLSSHTPAARGDVETIITKAMAQDASQRYGSAAELASDIERYLKQQPIEARPPTVSYLLGLFVRRHKALSAAVLVAAISLMAAASISLTFGISEARARHDAELRAKEVSAVNGFLNQMLTSADPSVAQGAELSLRDLLDQARTTLHADQSLPKSVAATLHQTLGNTYVQLALSEPANELLEAARPLAEQANWPLERLLRLEADYANAVYLTNDYSKAASIAEEALTRLPDGPHAGSIAYWHLQDSVISNLIESGQIEAGKKRADEMHALAVAHLGQSHPNSVNLLQLRATAARLAGDFSEALRLAQEVVEIRQQSLGPSHPETLHSENGVATHLSRMGKQEEAIEILRKVLRARQKILGDEHLDSWRTEGNLAVALSESGRPEDTKEAAAILRALVDKYVARYGSGTRYARVLMNNLATLERDLGNLAAGETLLRGVIAAQQGQPKSQHSDLYMAATNLALNLKDQGRLEEALENYVNALNSAREGLPDGHPHLYIIQGNYGHALLLNRNYDQASVELDAAHEGLVRTLGTEHPRTEKVRGWLTQLSSSGE